MLVLHLSYNYGCHHHTQRQREREKINKNHRRSLFIFQSGTGESRTDSTGRSEMQRRVFPLDQDLEKICQTEHESKEWKKHKTV